MVIVKAGSMTLSALSILKSLARLLVTLYTKFLSRLLRLVFGLPSFLTAAIVSLICSTALLFVILSLFSVIAGTAIELPFVYKSNENGDGKLQIFFPHCIYLYFATAQLVSSTISNKASALLPLRGHLFKAVSQCKRSTMRSSWSQEHGHSSMGWLITTSRHLKASARSNS